MIFRWHILKQTQIWAIITPVLLNANDWMSECVHLYLVMKQLTSTLINSIPFQIKLMEFVDDATRRPSRRSFIVLY